MKKLYTIGAIACLFAACKPSVNITTPITSGNATFTNYLAIGNSWTAGSADNSLYVSSQLNSYPQRLFEQFATIAGTKGAKAPFVQPLLAGDYGWPNAKLILTMTYPACNPADSSLGPKPYPGPLDSLNDGFYWGHNPSINHKQINNIAVPTMRVVDYPVGGYGALNPYAYRFYDNPLGSPLDELRRMVNNLYPTFFTLWLGDYDVLGYAAAGGQGNGTMSALPVAGNIFNKNDISNIDYFQKIYDSIVNLSISTGAGGALINIPYVYDLPYFNTVPMNGLLLTRMTQVDSLVALYGPSYNKAFDTGANYFIIKDHNNLTRQAVPGELLLLDSTLISHIQCAGWGSIVPIPCQYVLTTDELQNIKTATDAFNSYIQIEAQLHHLAYVDMNSFFRTLTTGYSYNGIKYTAQYVNGGAFSLDGLNFTQRGYALIANQIITTVNAYYHSNIPLTNANSYNGISFP